MPKWGVRGERFAGLHGSELWDCRHFLMESYLYVAMRDLSCLYYSTTTAGFQPVFFIFCVFSENPAKILQVRSLMSKLKKLL